MASWTEIDRYREWVAKHPGGLADPDKDGYDDEHRDVKMNRYLVEQIGQIVNMEKDYLSAPKLGPLAKAVYARIDRVREELRTVGRRRDDILAEIEDQEYAHLRGKGAEKRRATANIKKLQAEGVVLKKRYDELIAYQRNLVDWDLGLAVAKDAGIPAFDKRWTRYEEHDFKFTQRALGWAPSGFEVRDEHNKVVARARTRTAAHRTSRRANMAGSIHRTVRWRTRAPFFVNHRWRWVTWTNDHGNKHAAIIEKAKELGATRWDFGQADHDMTDRVNY